MELVIATRCAAPHMVSAAGWGGMGMGAWHLHLQHPDVLTCGSGDSQREKLKAPQCLLGSCPCPYSCHHGFSWDLPAFPSDITTLSPPHSFPYFWEEQTLSSTPLCQPRLEERNDQATHLDTGSNLKAPERWAIPCPFPRKESEGESRAFTSHQVRPGER